MSAVICNYCDRPAKLVTGATIYPARHDLAALKFWRCDPCGAHVGCHRAGSWRQEGGKRIEHTGVEPLGRLSNAELRRAKQEAHAAFDPVWKSRGMERLEAYAWLAGLLGISVDNCHIGMMDLDGCRAVVAVMKAQAGRKRRAAA